MKQFLVIVGLLICWSVQGEELRVKNEFPQSPTIAYAIGELNSGMSALAKITKPDGKRFTFTFKKDPAYEQLGTFAFSCDNRNRVVFTAGEPIGILHALYSFCEELGVMYDVTEASYPPSVDWQKVKGIDRKITPHVRWRGIRQHVNFPMDISSYPIEQAVAYLKSLTRLRFNKLVVHSYPFQWYEDDITADTINYAGNFFYGDKHNFSGSDFLKSIASMNESYFCIPKAEPVYDNSAACSKVAIEWMRQLLTEAKTLGLKVQFSFEPRQFSVEQGVKLAHKIVETYPQIDDLELITEETGGWGEACTDEEVRKTLEAYFGSEALADTVFTNPIAPKQRDLEYLYRQVGTIKDIIRVLENDPSFKRKINALKLGIYCSKSQYTYPAYRLARKSLPDNRITVMSSHGSRGTAKAFSQFVRSKEDLAKTELYSWIEFDGLMYQQQNAIEGIGSLLEQMDELSPGVQHYSIMFNHWRTAENRTSFRYASEVTLGKTLKADAFYTTYAHRLAIQDTKAYCEAMGLLSEADGYATVNLGNIGFCWVGAWRNGGSFTRMNPESIAQCAALYVKAGDLITGLYTNAKDDRTRTYLGLLGNRTLCSVLYLNAFKDATALRTIVKAEDGTILESEKARAAEICNHALAGFERYMKTYALIMPDRGCEGTVMSVWAAPMQGLRVLRNTLGGIPLEEVSRSSKSLDAPPLPIFYEGL